MNLIHLKIVSNNVNVVNDTVYIPKVDVLQELRIDATLHREATLWRTVEKW
jgi:hypothetical protein